MFRRRSRRRYLIVRDIVSKVVKESLRLFLFHTWLGSGAPATFLSPNWVPLGVESRRPLVDFATKRGREVSSDEELEEAAELAADLVSADVE